MNDDEPYQSPSSTKLENRVERLEGDESLNETWKRGLPNPLWSLQLPFFVLTHLHRHRGGGVGRRRVNRPGPPSRRPGCGDGGGIAFGGDECREVLKWRRQSHCCVPLLCVQVTTRKTWLCFTAQSPSSIEFRHVDLKTTLIFCLTKRQNVNPSPAHSCKIFFIFND